MAFEQQIKDIVDRYISAHLAGEAWHVEYFSFIDDSGLAKRLGEEFISARYIYKLLEGIEASEWLLRAQIRNQILSYASIYEAAIHHLLFDVLHQEPAVVALTEFKAKKEISIPPASIEAIRKHLEHDGKRIIPMYETTGKVDKTKVRFDMKAECAASLGLIDASLKDDLIEFYEARNAIHIHAEIRKSMEYQIELSKRAYMRLKPFKEQIEAALAKRSQTV